VVKAQAVTGGNKADKLHAHLPRINLTDEAESMGLAPEQVMEARKGRWVNVKEARMVPKEKAAYAYRETVQRRIDPALMEWSGAGIFSARIFPLAPRCMHRIVIGYDVNLVQAGNDMEYRLDLPGDDLPARVH
jgi:hypothetical protein